MKTILISFLIGLLGVPVYPAAVIFSGSDVKTLKSNIDLNGNSKILSGSTDPSASATSAPIGSLYLNTSTGYVYRKVDSGSSTSWVRQGFSPFSQGNLLGNPDWETGTASWTASAGTYSRNTTAANVGSGVGSGKWITGAASRTLTSTAVAIPPGLYGRNGVVSCLVQGAASAHTFAAYDGTNTLSSVTTPVNSGYGRVSANFTFPSSGNIQIQITSAASETLYFDDCYVGGADGFNVAQVSQASFIGEAYIGNTASCTWTHASASFGAFGTTAACPGPTVVSNPGPGTIQTTDTDLPQFTVNGLPAGNYLVTMQFSYAPGGNDGVRLTDGTTNVDLGAILGNESFHLSGNFNYTTSGNRTYTIHSQQSAGTATLYGYNTGPAYVRFHIYRFPSALDTIYTADKNSNWYWGGHQNDCTWTSTSSSFADPATDNACTYADTNNGNFGTVVGLTDGTAGHMLPGITWTPPRAGTYRVCAYVPISNNSTSKTYEAQIIDGSSTLIAYQAANNDAASSYTVKIPICGPYTVTSVASASMKIQFRTQGGGTMQIGYNGYTAPTTGRNAIDWEITPLSYASPSNNLVGTVVTTAGSSVSLINGATVTTGGTVTETTGDWINGNCAKASSVYTCTLNAVYSVAPSCTVAPLAGAAATAVLDTVSTTQVIVRTFNVTLVATDEAFHLICLGAK